ncbi:MAG: tripartite tricarboxylate transporter substrate binding protein [Hyphomicrobiales bacterium]|nr:tripartite tricarboxylate transporter substrate binding protein [Hyphomicrobiales bacterium]
MNNKSRKGRKLAGGYAGGNQATFRGTVRIKEDDMKWTKTNRRQFVRSALVATALPLAGISAALAEDAASYPSKNVTFICAFPAGSGADIFVRFFAKQLEPIMKRTIIVQNRAGASGNLATRAIARAKPDGYTIYVHAPSALAANMHLFKKPAVDVRTQIRVAATIGKLPFMLTVHSNSKLKSVKDVIELARSKGDKATFATTAATGQVTAAMFHHILKIKGPVEVPYRTGPDTLPDLASGRLDYAFHDPVLALSQARAGKLRVLAVSTKDRMASLPDIPSLSESGATGLHVMGWWGAIVPAKTPKPIVEKINAMFQQMVKSDATKKFLNRFGTDPFSLSADDAHKLLVDDVDAWGKFQEIAKIPKKG